MTMNANSKRVSVIGLGLMGSALAEALLSAGHEVIVWNRSPEKTKALIAKGAAEATSVSRAFADAQIVIICVTGHAATMELLEGIAEPDADRTLVQLSSMTPDESRELASWAQSREIGYLDGSILGLPSTVVQGLATVIFSGPRPLFDANERLLSALGTAKHLSPEIGASVAFDRVWYAYVYANAMAFMQGAAMAHALGFSLDVYYDTVKARSPVIVEQCLLLGERIAARNYETSDARIDVWADTFEDTLSICREKGVDDSLPSAVLSNLRRTSAAGHGDSDLAAVFETLIAGTG